MNQGELSGNDLLHALPQGWLTADEAELLYRGASMTEGPILEVGSYRGRSTVLLARLGRPVYAVDPFKGFAKHDPTGELTEAMFHDATDPYPNVTLFKCRIEDWKPLPVGFAYLDGDHTYPGTVSQVLVAKQCGPTIIALHDVNDDGGGLQVKKACLELLGPWQERVGRLAIFNG